MNTDKHTNIATSRFNAIPEKEKLAPADFDIIADTKTSKVWILHEKPFTNQNRIVKAVYNPEKKTLKFVSRDGGIQYLGAKVKKLLQPHLERATEVTAILTDKDGNINNLFVVPLMQAETAESG